LAKAELEPEIIEWDSDEDLSDQQFKADDKFDY
jgi:hypothetical protein